MIYVYNINDDGSVPLSIFFDLFLASLCCPRQAMSTPQPPSASSVPDASSLTTSSTMEPDGGEEEEDVIAGWLLMQECWSECEEQQQLEGGGTCAVRFIDDPYSSLLVFQSSSSYITINGNEETCGSSFSDSGTSFMATLHSTTAPLCNYSNDEEEEVLPSFLGLHDEEEDVDDDLLPANPQL